MGLCEESAFLRLLPTSGWRLVWSWENGNGTTIEKSGSASSRSDCFVELVNLAAVMFSLVIAVILIVKCRYGDNKNRCVLLLMLLLLLSLLRVVLLSLLLL